MIKGKGFENTCKIGTEWKWSALIVEVLSSFREEWVMGEQAETRDVFFRS